MGLWSGGARVKTSSVWWKPQPCQQHHTAVLAVSSRWHVSWEGPCFVCLFVEFLVHLAMVFPLKLGQSTNSESGNECYKNRGSVCLEVSSQRTYSQSGKVSRTFWYWLTLILLIKTTLTFGDMVPLLSNHAWRKKAW